MRHLIEVKERRKLKRGGREEKEIGGREESGEGARV